MPDTHLPKDFWDVKNKGNLRYNDAISPEDERYADLNSGRGPKVFDSLFKQLGLDKDGNPKLVDVETSQYILFCGHRGCGKSTELKRIAHILKKPDAYFVVECNIVEDLDPNNIEYVDILFLAAQRLADVLSDSNIEVGNQHMEDLKAFFNERIISSLKSKDFSTGISAGGNAKTGFALVASIFGQFTAAFKYNSTHKEEVRTIVKNHFSLFKTIFNRMLEEIKENIKRSNRGKNLIIIIDGTDRLTREDCDRIFINNASQLTQIETNFIYTVPIHIVYEDRQVANFYDKVFVLPMVIIEDHNTGKRDKEGWSAMEDMIRKRIPDELFDSSITIKRAIEMSGGHPRELLHILQEAFNSSDTDLFDRDAVELALDTIKADYMRFLDAEDYSRLARLEIEDDKESDDRMKRLLFNSAALEYNSYWRMVNPIVRETKEYKKAYEREKEQSKAGK